MIKNPIFFKNLLLISALFCAFLIYSGIIELKQKFYLYSLIPQSDITKIEGKITSNPTKISSISSFGGKYRFDFDVNKVFSKSLLKSSAKGKVSVIVSSEILESLLPNKLYTSAKTDAGILFENGIKLELFVDKIKENTFSVISASYSKKENNIFDFFNKIRAFGRLSFKRIMFSWGETGGFFLALLTGSKEYTDSSIANSFRNAGLSHILALSGMHLSLFGFLSLSLGKIISGKKFSSILYIISLLFFVWFAGLSPSLFRALLCSSFVFLISLLRFPKINEVTILSASFLIHINLFPNQIFEISFILSYSALFGILILSEFISSKITIIFPPFVSSSISSSFSAQIFTSPISLFFFGKVALIGVVSTVFISPLVTLFIYFGLFSVLICLFAPFLSPPLSVIMSFIYNLIRQVALFFADFPTFSL